MHNSSNNYQQLQNVEVHFKKNGSEIRSQIQQNRHQISLQNAQSIATQLLAILQKTHLAQLSKQTAEACIQCIKILKSELTPQKKEIYFHIRPVKRVKGKENQHCNGKLNKIHLKMNECEAFKYPINNSKVVVSKPQFEDSMELIPNSAIITRLKTIIEHKQQQIKQLQATIQSTREESSQFKQKANKQQQQLIKISREAQNTTSHLSAIIKEKQELMRKAQQVHQDCLRKMKKNVDREKQVLQQREKQLIYLYLMINKI